MNNMEDIVDGLSSLKLNVTSPEKVIITLPPPIPMRKSLSVGNIAVQPVQLLELQQPDDPMYLVLRNAIMKEVMLAMPTLVKEALNAQLVPAMSEAFMDNSIFNNVSETSPVDDKTNDADLNTNDLNNKLNGYKIQVDTWINEAKSMKENDMPKIKKQLKTLQETIKATEKSIVNKTKNYLATEKKITCNLKEMTSLMEQLQAKLNSVKENNVKVTEIDASQKFVSAEYDELMKVNNRLKEKVDKMEKEHHNLANKTEHIFNYSHWDHVVFGGVPYFFGRDKSEDCKQMIVNICRELHYNIPIREISTAHRLKQHHSKSTPPGIIVRFKDRDIRNDVLKLRRLTKEKQYWRSYGIQKLYINEHLTPTKRKLMYLTKVFTREMERIHGKIFVWTFKGEIFIRKNVENAPRKKIESEQDLDDIKKGTISLDPDVIVVSTNERGNNVVNSEIVTVPPMNSINEFPLLSDT